MTNKLTILSLNIGNPSLERAKRQRDWLNNRSEDIFVLTETKNSTGCNYLADYYSGSTVSLFEETAEPCDVIFPKAETGDLGVMIISKRRIAKSKSLFNKDSIYYAREIEAETLVGQTTIRIMGLYIPSRNATDEKIARKKIFIDSVLNAIPACAPDIIIGDFNILQPDHIPHYSTFLPWEYDFYKQLVKFGYIDAFRLLHPNDNEYSWVGRTNNGYRYDHCFASGRLTPYITKCEYIHESRSLHLTDHSAISLTLSWEKMCDNNETLVGE